MKKWMKYVKPYWPYFILGPLLMIVEVVGEVVLPRLLANITNGLTEGGAYQNAESVPKILGWAGLMILTSLIAMAGGVGGAYFGAKASVNFAADLRTDVYAKVQRFSFANTDRFSTGSLVTRLTNDVTQMQNFINMLLRMCMRSPGMLIGAVIMAITMSPKLSLVLLIAIPLLLITQSLIIVKGFPRFSKLQTKVDGLNAKVQENVTNIRVVKSFVREKHESEKFAKANSDLMEAGLRAMNIMILLQPTMMLLMYLTTAAVLWIGGQEVINFVETGIGMKVGDLSAYLTYITQILMSLIMLTIVFMMSSRAIASSRRISEVLNEKIDIDDSKAGHPDALVTRGEIEFRNVGFRYYKNSEEPVLQSINLHILPGETIGIIGSTGCGKTSLVSLIPRLYDVDEGSVLVDGIDVRDYNLRHLRDGVGIVLQKNVLFSGTVADNLRWGNPDADEEELRKYAAYAQADGFVSSFSDGYEHVIEQGGSNVSGGQKQRLCIARTLLKKPSILIFDDSTSAVDTATEKRIRDAFRNDLPHATKIIIAQRISSVMDADAIVVMDEGRITGYGTHEELLASNIEYQEIYNSQMGEKEDDSHGKNA